MATAGDRPAARPNGRKFTADVLKQLKEMTNAADEDIQMALQECNGDVNRAAMAIIESAPHPGAGALAGRCARR